METFQNEKMVEFPKMTESSKNSINAKNLQKLNISGEFPIFGWISVID